MTVKDPLKLLSFTFALNTFAPYPFTHKLRSPRMFEVNRSPFTYHHKYDYFNVDRGMIGEV